MILSNENLMFCICYLATIKNNLNYLTENFRIFFQISKLMCKCAFW